MSFRVCVIYDIFAVHSYPFCHLRYIDIVQTKSTEGMKLSYRLHKLLQSSSDRGPIRGIRLFESSEMSVASSLYTLVRANRANRRYLLTTVLKMFEDDYVRCRTLQSCVMIAL